MQPEKTELHAFSDASNKANRPIAKLSDQAFAQHRNEAYNAKRELH